MAERFLKLQEKSLQCGIPKFGREIIQVASVQLINSGETRKERRLDRSCTRCGGILAIMISLLKKMVKTLMYSIQPYYVNRAFKLQGLYIDFQYGALCPIINAEMLSCLIECSPSAITAIGEFIMDLYKVGYRWFPTKHNCMKKKTILYWSNIVSFSNLISPKLWPTSLSRTAAHIQTQKHTDLLLDVWWVDTPRPHVLVRF